MPEWYEAAPVNVEDVAGEMLKSVIETDDPEPYVDWGSVETSLETPYLGIGHGAKWILDSDPFDPSPWLVKSEPPWVKYVYAPFQFPSDYTPWVPHGFHQGGYVGPEWNPRPDQCPHCLRPRHSTALRQEVASMLGRHQFDPEYNAEEDDSDILCVGADYQGPPRGNVTTPRVSFGSAGVMAKYWGVSNSGYTMQMLQDMKQELKDASPTITYQSIMAGVNK